MHTSNAARNTLRMRLVSGARRALMIHSVTLAHREKKKTGAATHSARMDKIAEVDRR